MFAKIAHNLSIKKSPRVREVIIANQGNPSSIDQHPDATNFIKTYGSHAIVYASIFEIANSASSVPFKLFQTEDDERFEIQNSPLKSLLQRPNPFMSRRDLWEFHFTAMETVGMSFWELETENFEAPPSEFNPIIGIWPLRPDRVKFVPDKDKYIRGFVYDINGTEKPLPLEKIIFFKYTNLEHDFNGLSPLQPATKAILSDLNCITWNSKFFENGAMPEGMFTSTEAMSDPQRDRLKQEIETKYSGSRNWRRPMVAEMLEWQETSRSHRDMEFKENRKMNWDEIIAAIGTPKLFLGMSEQINKATAQVEEMIFWKKTVIPKLLKFQDVLNAHFFPLFGEGISGEHDVSQIDALLPDNNEMISSITQAIGGPWMSRNEGRRIYADKMKQDLTDVEGGDQILVPFGQVPLSDVNADLFGDPEPEPDEDERMFSIKSKKKDTHSKSNGQLNGFSRYSTLASDLFSDS